jgi:hypothetical protein
VTRSRRYGERWEDEGKQLRPEIAKIRETYIRGHLTHREFVYLRWLHTLPRSR